MHVVKGRTDRVVVVGAGLSGLSAALHLRGAGHEVTVVERQPHPGGLAGRLDVGGHRIDTGPTVLTMPELLDDAFAAVGHKREDHLELLPLHPAYRAAFADGTALDVHTDADRMEQAVRDFAGDREAQGYRDLRAWLTKLYEVERDRFIGASFDSPLDLVGPDLVRLARLGGFGSLAKAVGRFLRDDRLRRVFTFQSLYAGVAPKDALAAYAVIAYMDTIAGVWFPRGGMRAVPQALADAAAEAGVVFHYGVEVEELERVGHRVNAVRTADTRIACDAVVLATGPAQSIRLLRGEPRRVVPLRWSPSAVVVHLSSGRVAEDLAHHTISFGDKWNGTFDEIIRQGKLMSDPSLLLTTPTLTDPALAPEGRHLQYLLAPCPNLDAAPLRWDALAHRYAEELVDEMSARKLLVDAEPLAVVTPDDWARGGQAAGTPFSAAHTFAQTGPFRPGNLPFRDGNVVLAGSGTTPGVGIPPVLISGRLAAQRLRHR
ncbi:phytoene desaturase family protein [Lentzea sp. BCCO 10_0798]|uniref:Phytoene desaturase family protein n=1 Tax=Lentzea kristufekii TaxID=3095430 RepID=A0ABU4TWN8_9PSEU|nr:phytoene desaturase family protein [Lentzea sp. BCCO 10_0798]MDX8052231.1 phytoene desaturase family protein [Lentzea sp. BCCO 10_0798]